MRYKKHEYTRFLNYIKRNKVHIKRPLFTVSLGLIGVLIILFNILESTIDIPRMSDVDAYVQGTVDDIEYKNGKIYLYIKKIDLNYSQSSDNSEEELNTINKTKDIKEYRNTSDYSKEILSKEADNILIRHLGCVCIFKDTESIGNLIEENRVNIGSKVILKGSLNVYEKASNPGGFDARNYYNSKGYIYKLRNCQLVETDSKINYPKTISKRLRDNISSLYDDTLPEDEAAIMRAITLADRSDIDNETKSLFTDSGSGHLLAVSGLHISLIAGILLLLFKKLLKNPDIAYIPAMIMLVLYGFLIGFSPSSLRAIVMFIILCIGKIRKKTYDTLTAMALAALITAIIRPLSCLQSGFHMSYLAIMGIAIVNPSLNSYKGKKKAIRDSFLMSISVTLMTLPVIVNSYYKIPLFAVILNLILIPGMTFLLSFGFAFLALKGVAIAFSSLDLSIINIILSVLTKILAFIIHIILKLYMLLMQLSLSLPFSELICGHKSIIKCVLYFLVLVLSSFIAKSLLQDYWRILKKQNNRLRHFSVINTFPPSEGFRHELLIREIKRNKWIVRIVYMLVLLINAVFFLSHISKNRVEFIDVGQGLCACIFYNGKTYMYDCGSSDNDSLYEIVIEPYLYYNGKKEIDILFLSHDDKDHISAVLPMLEEDSIRINNLVIANVLKNNFSEIIQAAKEDKVNVLYAKAADEIAVGNYKRKGKEKTAGRNDILFCVISPDDKNVTKENRARNSNGNNRDVIDPNKNSLVVYAVTNEGTILFMGDSEIEAEEKVILSNIHPDILQAAHHGSQKDTNTLEFLTVIKPRLSVISCGFNNRYNHPGDRTIDNLNEIHSIIKRTDYEGCISIRLNKK